MDKPPSRPTIRRPLAYDRGASAVEFAIIAPLFFMLCFGMISGAILFNQKNELTHAAREGARYGATIPIEQQFNLGTCTTTSSGTVSASCWAQNIANTARSAAYGNLGTTIPGNRVCVALVIGNPATVVTDSGGSPYFYDSSGASTGPCFDDGGADLSRRVQVRVWRNGSLNAILFNMSLSLQSEAVGRSEEQPAPSASPTP